MEEKGNGFLGVSELVVQLLMFKVDGILGPRKMVSIKELITFFAEWRGREFFVGEKQQSLEEKRGKK